MNTIDFALFLPLLLRVSLLLLSVVLLLVALKRFEPRLRVMMVRAAIYVLPILIWGSFGDPIFRFENPFQADVVEVKVATVAAPIVATESVGVPAGISGAEPVKSSPLSIPAVLLVIWLAIAIGLLVRDIIGLARLRKKSRESLPAEEALVSRWQEICLEFGIAHRVALLVQKVSESESPFLCPGRRPALVLPSGMVEKFGADTMDQVFRHEAAHISRGDVQWMPLIRLVTCLLWFHPLMWVISALHLRSCEEAADAAAARSGGTDAYREALAALALELLPGSHPAASVALIRIPGVSDRLRAVRGNASLSPPSKGLITLGVAAVLFIGVLLGSIGMAQNDDQATLKNFIWENAIPTLSLKDIELKDAIATVEKISREVDPDGAGFQIYVSDDFAKPYALISLKLTNVPFSEGLRYLSALAGGEFRVTSDGVIFENKKDQREGLLGEISDGWEVPGKWAPSGLGTKIPTVNFTDTPLKEALAFLEEKTKGNDGSDKGVQFKIADGFKNAEAPITLRLSNVKIGEVLRFVTSLAQAAYIIDGDQVTVMDKKQHRELRRTVVFTAPQRLFPQGDKDAKVILTEVGIDFPEGCSAIYNRETGQLIVRNHQPMMDLIGEWLKNKLDEKSVGENVPVRNIGGVEKVLKLKIPVIEFAETPFEDAIAFLGMKMREMDPAKRGVDIRISANLKNRKSPVSFRFVDIPFGEALRHVTAAVDATYYVEDHILIIGKEEINMDLFTEVFQVSPSRFSTGNLSPVEILKEAGVEFPENASAVYNRGTQQLIIRNTQSNLAKLKQWLAE